MAYTKRGRSQRRTPTIPAAPVDHPPVDLLRKAGATEAVIREVQRSWSELDSEERVRSAEDLRAMSDEERRAAVRFTEVAMAAGGDQLDDELADDALALFDEVPDGTVPEVEEWVAEKGEPGRLAAIAVELRRPPDERRKTLLEGLNGERRG